MVSIPFSIHIDPAAGVFYLITPEGYIDYERPFPAAFPNFTSPYDCDQGRQAVIGYPDGAPEREMQEARVYCESLVANINRPDFGERMRAAANQKGLVARRREGADVTRAAQKKIVIDLVDDKEFVDFAEEPEENVQSRKRERERDVDEFEEASESDSSSSESNDSSNSSGDESSSSDESGDESGSSSSEDEPEEDEPDGDDPEEDEPEGDLEPEDAPEILFIENRDDGTVYIEIYRTTDRWRFNPIFHGGMFATHVYNHYNGVYYHWTSRQDRRSSYSRDPSKNGVQKRKIVE